MLQLKTCEVEDLDCLLVPPRKRAGQTTLEQDRTRRPAQDQETRGWWGWRCAIFGLVRSSSPWSSVALETWMSSGHGS